MSAVPVVVGILRRADGRVLVATRDAGRHEGGRLEFPGGKLDPGEPAAEGLSRELAEEIGIRVESQRPLIRLRHRYPECTVDLDVRLVERWQGEPIGREGQALSWRSPADLRPDELPGANRPILASLRWPALMLVTPAMDAVSSISLASLCDTVARACTHEPHFIQLRAPGSDPGTVGEIAAVLMPRIRAHPGSLLLVNGLPGDTPDVDGWHLPAREARRLSGRPAPRDRLLSCACHDAVELARAEELEADLVVIGPVHPTPSHPDAACLGWEALTDLAAQTAIPVFAIGGLCPNDLDRARAHGAVGVAGIRGFASPGAPRG